MKSKNRENGQNGLTPKQPAVLTLEVVQHAFIDHFTELGSSHATGCAANQTAEDCASQRSENHTSRTANCATMPPSLAPLSAPTAPVTVPADGADETTGFLARSRVAILVDWHWGH